MVEAGGFECAYGAQAPDRGAALPAGGGPRPAEVSIQPFTADSRFQVLLALSSLAMIGIQFREDDVEFQADTFSHDGVAGSMFVHSPRKIVGYSHVPLVRFSPAKDIERNHFFPQNSESPARFGAGDSKW